jgi:hypothetical protein
MTTPLCYEGWDSIKTHTVGYFTNTDSDMACLYHRKGDMKIDKQQQQQSNERRR